MTKSLLQEDECAPDAKDSFKSEFQNIVGLSLFDFQTKLDTTHISLEGGYSDIWFDSKYFLDIHADFQHFTLYNLSDKRDYIIKVLNEIIEGVKNET